MTHVTVLDRILEACFGPASYEMSSHGTAARGTSSRDSSIREADLAGLEPFQMDAVRRLSDIIVYRRGAILADSVGLGKTHVAAAIIRAEIASGGSVLVTGPAQLRRHWARHLRGLSRCRWVSHTAMSRGRRPTSRAGLVVVDEAHAFRNPATSRYAALALACEHARVLLVTATPVNNSLFDFYHLVRLFAPEDLFADIGVPDLLGAVAAAARGGGSAEVRRVASAVMVRRTRHSVSALRSGSTSSLRFPAPHEVETLRYDPGDVGGGIARRMIEVVPSLTFPAHGHWRGRRHAVHAVQARDLMRLGLIKRLESSTWALRASVQRHLRLLDCFLTAAYDGFLFDATIHASHAIDIDGAIQLSFDSLVLPRWPRVLDRDAMIEAAESDRRLLRDVAHGLRERDAESDRKLDCLHVLLDNDLSGEKVLIFTEYQDTAVGLWQALSDRGGVALVHGSDARLGRTRSSRRAVIERFAPLSNGARQPRPAQRVNVLIATDVLAEGLNLQDARVVISYDMPWNPVRLAQRIGRIDRLGSPHERIRALAFVPDQGVDEMLQMMKRIRHKLKQIRVVGGDAPAFDRSARGARASDGRRVRDALIGAAEAREAARTAYLAAAASASPAAPAQPLAPVWPRAPSTADRAVAAISSALEDGSALCCFRTPVGTALLVIVQDGLSPEIDSARAWSALARAIDQGCTVATNSGARAAEMERAARRAIMTLRSGSESPDLVTRRASRPASRAGNAVIRWLHSRPGGPSEEDAERADRLLTSLRYGGPAGLDVRIERAMVAVREPDDAVTALSAVLPAARRGAASASRRSEHSVQASRLELVGILLASDREIG